MNGNNFFLSNQSGFQQLHSTLTCLIKNTGDWYSGLDLGKLVGLVFIDLKKAFDTVNHDILRQKLHCYGIHGSNPIYPTGNNFAESMESNRKLIVLISVYTKDLA